MEGNLDTRAVSLFVVNRRPPVQDDDVQDAAFAFQVEMAVEAHRPFVPGYDPRGQAPRAGFRRRQPDQGSSLVTPSTPSKSLS